MHSCRIVSLKVVQRQVKIDMCNLAQAAGVQRFVYISTVAPCSEPRPTPTDDRIVESADTTQETLS